jgi:hypothetical protein
VREGRHGRRATPGTFEVLVGRSSAEIELKGTLRLAGPVAAR